MKAIEFKTTIKNNQIQIPDRIQPELKTKKNIRVIVLMEDSEIYDRFIFKETASKQFLQGYADSDSIYDNY
ncbi:MAG: hypothetical protein DRJ05_06020 [Bacteroidetes bacterium]|nr:MAG: hypothetical protein DRJ05_06020 [Bacteroidota bacterium]